MDCIFCQILAGEIPTNFVYRDEEIAAFRDINPQAPTHILIIPVRHIPSCNDLSGADEALVGRMVGVARCLAEKEGIAERGYRLVLNCGPEGGQLVPHLHMHLLGGKKLKGELS